MATIEEAINLAKVTGASRRKLVVGTSLAVARFLGMKDAKKVFDDLGIPARANSTLTRIEKHNGMNPQKLYQQLILRCKTDKLVAKAGEAMGRKLTMAQVLYILGIPGVKNNDPKQTSRALRMLEAGIHRKSSEELEKIFAFLSDYYLEGSQVFKYIGPKKVSNGEVFKFRSDDGLVLKIRPDFFGGQVINEGEAVMLMRNLKKRFAPESFVRL